MTKEEFIELVNFKLLGEDLAMIEDFVSYWTESSLNGKKMRFQAEKFFDVKRRFNTWKRISKKLPNGETLSPQELTLIAFNQAKENMGL